MAIELLSYPIREASSAGLISIEHFNRAFSTQTWTLDSTEATVSKFRKVTPEPNRTGHARFRRAPVQPQSHSQESNPVQTFGSVSPKIDFSAVPGKDCGGLSASTSGRSSSTSGRSSSTISGEGSVSNGKGGSISPLVFQAPARSSGKPPLPGKRYREHDLSGCRSGETSGCHCGKRKHTAKRTIRVAAISSSVADIPADDYSWRKYGQKPIKGSTFPRGYYRCSAAKECPARKHVERANDDPNVLIVTYEGMHRHTLGAKQVIIPTVRG